MHTSRPLRSAATARVGWLASLQLAIVALLAACTSGREAATPSADPSPSVRPSAIQENPSMPAQPSPAPDREIATLGAGCFWCIEAVLEQTPGVLAVRSGYMGGRVDAPTYEQVCSGTTGHAEVVEVTFDPRVLSFERLLDVFWKLHDPTTLNRQGNDVGTQYRSAIFFHSEQQRATAERSKQAQGALGVHAGPIVTEITAATRFWVAEDYHQGYYQDNREAPYCRFVIAPKLEKLGLEK